MRDSKPQTFTMRAEASLGLRDSLCAHVGFLRLTVFSLRLGKLSDVLRPSADLLEC